MSEHIHFNGFDYWQQRRGNKLYWYRRPLGVSGTGKVEYVGVNLPDGAMEQWQLAQNNRLAIYDRQSELSEQMAALQKLLDGQELSFFDRANIIQAGMGHLLIE